jgi:hypothetical protein
MKHLISAAAALALLAGTAVAQTSTPSASTTGSTSAASTITPQEQDAIKAQIQKDRTGSVSAPSGFAAKEGATLPQVIAIHALPADVAGGPGMSYAVIGDKAVVVDPQRQILAIIEPVK